jgi:hypothetical protein
VDNAICFILLDPSEDWKQTSVVEFIEPVLPNIVHGDADGAQQAQEQVDENFDLDRWNPDRSRAN